MNQLDPSCNGLRLLDAAEREMRPPRILLVDDDAEMRNILEQILSEEGYEVVLAEDGFDLLDRVGDTWLEAEAFDLVLSDVRMPGCTGLDALEALREEDWATPVLFMTAFGSRRPGERLDAREAERLGAEILDKPFELGELLERVRRLVPPDRYAEGWSSR